MSKDDIAVALDLINAEGWGYTAEELERMLKLDPEGSFLHVDGKPLGVVTCVTYGKTGVIGHLVVSGSARGKKIGQSLLKNAIDYCERSGTDSILLYATEEGRRLYRKFGFAEIRQAACARTHFTAADHGPAANPCTQVREDDLGQICALDRKYFGDDRRKVLMLLHSEFPEHSWKLEKEGRIIGFAMGRNTSSSFDFGPWECLSDSKSDAEAILRAVLRSFGEGSAYMGVFLQNKNAMEIFRSLGTEKEWTTTLMIRGAERYSAGIEPMCGVSAFELG